MTEREHGRREGIEEAIRFCEERAAKLRNGVILRVREEDWGMCALYLNSANSYVCAAEALREDLLDAK